MSSILLTATDVSKTFPHEGKSIPVLDGLNLTVNERESVAIIGASGAGKSTLLHLLGALDEPDSGTIIFRGTDIHALSASERAKFRNESIGFMFQFHHLLPEFSALENVIMPLLIGGCDRKEAIEQGQHWLDRVGLAARFEHRPSELSGGEQQRVALARALIKKPRLLLADEPTGNLDHDTGARIHSLFDELSQDAGTSMIIVTHNHELAQRQSRSLRLQNRTLEEVDQA
ncbi:MAG: ABC transporter ATP-binding protein [Bradymonadia bacterium]